MNLHKSKAPYADRCPIRDVLDRMGDRWSMLVMFITLKGHGMLRFTALKAQIPDVSQRMLAQTLRRLEHDGLVSRTVYPSIPPRVDYALTALGESFMQPLNELLAWAERHHDQVRAARRQYVPPQKAQAF
ncbi:MAG: helix-turn-helix domain-containing protein [Acidihalobacter sp.]|uniref:winged helix-turn-helix transcriptional regulator n=1 Tax=Acidihalobacter sp. TaxID=1872108 RepID=UPI00307CDF44